MGERRRHVRVKPGPSLPVRIARRVDALVRESIDVIDISVGGMALAMRDAPADTRMRVLLQLGSAPEVEIDVVVRWSKVGVVGVEFADLDHDTAHAVQRHVAELLERGGLP